MADGGAPAHTKLHACVRRVLATESLLVEGCLGVDDRISSDERMVQNLGLDFDR